MKQIYWGGSVFTGRLPLAQAFVVEDGRFAAVGCDADMLAMRADGDQVIDLKGAFVCPGFIDSHMHLVNYGYTMECCDLMANTASLDQVKEALRAFIRSENVAPGEWVRGRGWNHDYFADVRRMPDRHDLDEVSREHPICIVRCCGHCMVVNTAALEMLGIDGTAPQPEGGHYELDADGKPTGVFCDSAMSMVYTRLPKPDRAGLRRMILRACRALNSFGVTGAHTDDLCVFEGLDWREVIEAYRELEAENRLTVRVYEQSQLTTRAELQAFFDAGWNTGVGSDMFRIGPLKLLGDGSLGARTAFLNQDYADMPGERGLAIFTQEQFDEMIGLAHSNGMQVAIHAIGDGILDRILLAYERAFAACPREDHRSGIVHVQITRPDQLQRMCDMHLHAYVQTIFIDYDAHIVSDRVGEALAGTSYAFHGMREMGMHVSNGTDCPVERPIAMRGIQCAVTRRPLAGDLPPYRPEEAMTVEEALRSYTAEGAWASFQEKVKGEIRCGMLADFVVLSDNPFEVPADKIGEIVADRTYLGGECVFDRGE